MSRLTEALRRAGQHNKEQSVARAGDTSSISDYLAENPMPGTDQRHSTEPDKAESPQIEKHRAFMTPRSETDSRPTAGPPPRDRATPIEVTHRTSANDVRIVDVMSTLYRRRWLIAAVIAVSVAPAVVYNRWATPLYEAHARLLLEPNSPEVMPFRPLTEDQGRLDYFVTQMEVLRSPSTVYKTLEKLQLLDADTARQAGQLSQTQRGLTVTPVRSDMGESRLINIAFRAENAEYAARLANGIAQTYVDRNLESRRQGSRDASEWLNQRLAELRRDLKAGEGALQQYREQKKVLSLGDQQNIVVQKLAQLNALVTTARTERLEKQAVYEQLKAVQESGAPLDTFSPILANSFIAGLKAELAGLQRDRQQLSERLGDLHPDMIKVNAAIATTERRLHDEMAKVVEGIQNDYKAAQAKEQAMSAALEDQKREMLHLSQDSIGYSELQRNATSTQQMLETVLQRAKETELSGELQANNAKILDVAQVPGAPIWPRKQLNLIIALLGGSFIAAGLAFGLDYLNPRMVGPGEIAEALGLPLLGIAPLIRRLRNRPANFDALPPAFQEALRIIRTRIFLAPIAGASQSMAVTSTNLGEGKTVVASNLAVSIAMSGRRVLLVDADLRRAQLHSIFNVPRSPGLSDVIAGNAKSTDTWLTTPVAGLYLLAAGTHVTNPTDLLGSERLGYLLQELSQAFDVVVLDCPPVMAVADASIIAHAASSVLFVVGSGTTSRKAAQIAIDRISSVQGHLIGVVVNKAKIHPRSEYSVQKYYTDEMAQRKSRSAAPSWQGVKGEITGSV